LIGGLIFGGLIFVLIGGLIVGRTRGLIYGLNFGLIYGLRGALIPGLIFGMIVGLARLFTSEAAPETLSAVNQGTHRSVKMALMSGLIGGLTIDLIYGLIYGLRGPVPRIDLIYGLIMGLISALIPGLIVGLFFGGMFALKHFVLRLFLWESGSAPLSFVAFLEHARDLLFLRQVGGGYIFVHGLLREYFVSLSGAKQNWEEKTRAAPGPS
jgi:hypothetical protein